MKQKITQKNNANQAPELPISLRTDKDEQAYLTAKIQNNLHSLKDEPRLREWQFWALIENRFPYSLPFKTHHMLIPKREASESDLSSEEEAELKKIIEELKTDYDCRIINNPRQQSQKGHFHIHFLEYKDMRSEMNDG